MAARGSKSYPTNYQIGIHQVWGLCRADGVPVAGDEGGEEVTTAKTATGTYTLTMKTPFRRAMVFADVEPETIDMRHKITISGSVATVVFEVGGTDTDTIFRYHLVGSDDIVRRG